MMPLSFSLGVVVFGLLLFIFSWKKSRQSQFYSDTPLLIPGGVFVWGDGLILGPFWLIIGLMSVVLPWIFFVKLLCLFYALRSGYEVIYWLNHQSANKQYNPPLFRRVTWLQPDQAAILYQLMNMCFSILSLFGLLLTF